MVDTKKMLAGACWEYVHSLSSLCDSAGQPLFNFPHYALSYNCSGNLSRLFGLQPVILIITGRTCVFRTWPCLRTPCSFQKIYRYTVRETNAVRKPGQGNYKVHCKPLHTLLVLLRTWTKWWKTTRRDRATDWVDWGPDDHCGQAPHLQMRKLEQWRWILKAGCLISIISQFIISGKWVRLSEFSFRVCKMGTLWVSTL